MVASGTCWEATASAVGVGAGNPPDLVTKYLFRSDMWKHLGTLHMALEGGRLGAVPMI